MLADRHGNDAPLPVATIRSAPEDFVVDEIPAYTPSGKGEHLYLTIRKTGRNTLDVVRQITRALGADIHASGYAGMKDRHAITTQTISVQIPIATPIEPLLENLKLGHLEGVEILEVARHGNKLKPGHLVGNRFHIRLRGLRPEDTQKVREKLEETGRIGVPNAFGPQRFGRDGANPARALAWMRGEERGPRDRREQRMLFSALQSMMFNEVLDARIKNGTWAAVLAGDLAKKHDSGGLFLVPSDGPELEDAVARAQAGAISATGPMFGSKMRWPEGAPETLEREVLARVLPDASKLEDFRSLGEGTRRSLRLMVGDLEVETGPTSDGLRVSFVLPKGGYATTVLATACQLVDATLRQRDGDSGEDNPEPSEGGD